MKYLVLLISITALVLRTPLLAQTHQKPASESRFKLIEKPAIPIALIGLGILATNSDFEQSFHNKVRQQVGEDFSFKIDDYTQYMPIVQLYSSRALGFKQENHWFEQTKYLVLSNIVSSTIALSLKRIINKTRPDGDRHAFPSGHTMFAFTNATVLHKESSQTPRLWANSGYIFATITGGFRVVNSRHWISDVLAGAGLGIIATELIYHYKPFKRFNPFKTSKNKKNISLLPNIKDDSYGFVFNYRF